MKNYAYCCLILLLTLTSCLSHKKVILKELIEQNEEFVGKHSDELLKQKGSPDTKDVLSTGEEIWTYKSTKSGHNRGPTMSVGNADQHYVPMTSWNETINFIIGTNNIVKEVNIEVE
jgi:hypothetical protein